MFKSLIKICFILTSLLIVSCKDNTPIKIGLIGELSSESMGLTGRNGAELAISEINSSGGINGRVIEFISINHENSKDRSYSGVKELVGNGASVIIGPFLSSMAQSVKVASMESNTLIISPTVSTNKLTGIDDNFIRIIPPATTQGTSLANALTKNRVSSVLVIVDENNLDYSYAVFDGFKASLDMNKVYVTQLILSGTLNVNAIKSFVIETSPEAVLFVTNGINTAQIIKSILPVQDFKPSFYGAYWVKASGIIQHGGSSVEGMYLVDAYQNLIPTKKEKVFYKAYLDTYKTNPTIASRYSYEAVYLYKRAVEESNALETEKVLNSIINFNSVQGIADEYSFDKFGDVNRKNSIFKIENGEFVLLE
jgi:branched-chain amino acid transport system substrate-binding protein